MWDIHPHAITQKAKTVPKTVEEEKKAAPAKRQQARGTKPQQARGTKPQKARGTKPQQASNAKKLEFQKEELAFDNDMDDKAKFAFLRRQGVHFNKDEKYFACINCEMELNFTNDLDKALDHCNRKGHQINRFHKLKQLHNRGSQ